MTKREKLARAILKAKGFESKVTLARVIDAKTPKSVFWHEKKEAFAIVDAILDTLMETDRGMRKAGAGPWMCGDQEEIAHTTWQAMLKHIKEER